MSEKAITGDFVMEQLERFSFSIKKLTVVVLDNARIHNSKQIKERIPVWQQRGLKYEWLGAEDYLSKEHLRYSVKQALWAFGKS